MIQHGFKVEMTTLYYYNIEVSASNGDIDADSHALLTPCGTAICLELPSGEEWMLKTEKGVYKAMRLAQAKGFRVVTDDIGAVALMLKLTKHKRSAMKASRSKAGSKMAFGHLFG